LRSGKILLSVLKSEAGPSLEQLTWSCLLHTLDVLRRSKRRGSLLEVTKLGGLPNNRLESKSGLDIRNVLLLGTLTLLLRSHLACKALLHGSVPLTGGSEDVLESFLSLSICDIAAGLTALK
jgi:hypothetical protein